MDFKYLLEVAVQAAKEAGAFIAQFDRSQLKVESKSGGESYASQVVTEVDRQAESIILRILQSATEKYDLGLLTEEQIDDGSRLQKDYFWCIDPLDGTLAFINGTSGYSVAIALVAQSGETVLGVVHDVKNSITYKASKGNGAFKDGEPWSPEVHNKYLTYVTDKHLEEDERKEDIKGLLNKALLDNSLTHYEVFDGGGSIMNAIRVLEHAPAIMLKPPKPEAGGGSIWDFAATTIFFEELGLQATDFHRNPLHLNQEDSTFMNNTGVWYEYLTSIESNK